MKIQEVRVQNYVYLKKYKCDFYDKVVVKYKRKEDEVWHTMSMKQVLEN
jgi:hypothetical protein